MGQSNNQLFFSVGFSHLLSYPVDFVFVFMIYALTVVISIDQLIDLDFMDQFCFGLCFVIFFLGQSVL